MNIRPIKIIIYLLILLNIWVIIYLGNQYCFEYKNSYTGEHIKECGDKKYLENKYSEYFKRGKIDADLLKFNESFGKWNQTN